MKDVFIDRRNVLTGIAAVPLATAIPFISNKDTMFLGYNLLGKRVEDYKQLRYNLMVLYMFDYKDVVKVMYGDRIGTASWLAPNRKDAVVVVRTNDPRDYWEWYQTKDGVIYNKVQTDPQRGFPFISIEEHKKMFPNRWKNIA